MTRPHRPFRFTVQASRLPDPESLLPLARRAEEIGVDTLTVADHLDDQLAPLPALMAVAAATTTLRIGTLVLANDFRHPALVAKEAATLDRLSEGRLVFGIGAGWMTTDYESLGTMIDPPSVRIARLEEAIRVITALWSGEPVHHDGEFYDVHIDEPAPVPAQSPRPPLLIGGGGPKVLAVAARHADIVALNPSLGAGVIDHRAGPSATAEATDDKIAIVREAAGDRFDEIELQTRIHLAVVTDDRDATIDLLAGGFGLTRDEALATPHALCGTVEQICDDLMARRERHGISTIGLSASSLDDLEPVIRRLAGT